MSLVASMDGTKCELVHLLYMEKIAAFFMHVLDYLLILVSLDFASSCCLAGFQCCLAQGCSWSGIPTSSFVKERLFEMNFLILKFFPS